jgi:hypothetical protein
VFCVIPFGEETAMNFRMQRFNPTVQHFRKAGVVRDIKDVDSGISKVLSRPAGGEDFYTTLDKGGCYFQEVGFVVDANECALYFSHFSLSFFGYQLKRFRLTQVAF